MYGDVIIRERKGRYYVYILESSKGETRGRYVGPLTDVVQTYLKVEEGNESENGSGDGPPRCDRRDLNPEPPACRLWMFGMRENVEEVSVSRPGPSDAGTG